MGKASVMILRGVRRPICCRVTGTDEILVRDSGTGRTCKNAQDLGAQAHKQSWFGWVLRVAGMSPNADPHDGHVVDRRNRCSTADVTRHAVIWERQSVDRQLHPPETRRWLRSYDLAQSV